MFAAVIISSVRIALIDLCTPRPIKGSRRNLKGLKIKEGDETNVEQ